MSNKKKTHKKKRISKHILQARERQREKEAEAEGSGVVVAKASTPTKAAKKKSSHAKVKDPKDAQEYLSHWKHKDNGSGWKFNKNTQSWIFRHMYDADKIPKASFTLLLEYLSGLQGSTMEWVHREAIRKALRYKNWEAKNTSKENDETNKDETQEGQNDINKEKSNEDHKEDDERFFKLSDHDKRKEYKRCRKVLDQMKLLKPSKDISG